MINSILITGLGGQGVITCAKILSIMGKLEGNEVIGYEAKGDAQRGGKVTSLIRLFRKKAFLSTRLTKGALDLVLSMDIYETARNINLYSSETVIISHNNGILPPLARNFTIKMETPFSIEMQLKNNYKNFFCHNFLKAAKSITGNTEDMNIMLLCYAVRNQLIPMKKENLKRVIQMLFTNENHIDVDDIFSRISMLC